MPLSTKQMEYLAIAWQCFDTEPKIDYEKFKDVAGLASAASARELMRVTKNKLKSEYGALGASIASSNSKTSSPTKKVAGTTTPKSGAKRGRKAATEEDDEEEHTPATKKSKTTAAKKGGAGKENGAVKEEPTSTVGDEDDFALT